MRPPPPGPSRPPAPGVGPTDEELMERVQQGDAAAYADLFQRHHARLYGFLVRRSGDSQVAADLFQESFLAVHRARATWSRGRPFRPWLFGIALNAARDQERRIRRTPEMESPEEPPPGPEPRPDDRLDLERALQALPENLREAFLLGVVEGFDHNEVASQLGISPDNARARIARARARLRAMLAPGGAA